MTMTERKSPGLAGAPSTTPIADSQFTAKYSEAS